MTTDWVMNLLKYRHYKKGEKINKKINERYVQIRNSNNKISNDKINKMILKEMNLNKRDKHALEHYEKIQKIEKEEQTKEIEKEVQKMKEIEEGNKLIRNMTGKTPVYKDNRGYEYVVSTLPIGDYDSKEWQQFRKKEKEKETEDDPYLNDEGMRVSTWESEILPYK